MGCQKRRMRFAADLNPALPQAVLCPPVNHQHLKPTGSKRVEAVRLYKLVNQGGIWHLAPRRNRYGLTHALCVQQDRPVAGVTRNLYARPSHHQERPQGRQHLAEPEKTEVMLKKAWHAAD